MTFLKTISLAGALALTTTAASASSVSLEYKGPTAAGFQNVEITEGPSFATGSSPAGGFDFDKLDGDGNVLESFIAWCMDLSANLNQGLRDYHESVSFFTGVGEVQNAGDRVQTLFDAAYENVDATNQVQSTAFQLAIWEVIYDDDFTLGTGSFQATAASDVADAAQGWLEDAAGYTGGQKWVMTYFEAAEISASNFTNQQNIGTASAIPLPAAGWLLLGGLGALGALARRKRAAA